MQCKLGYTLFCVAEYSRCSMPHTNLYTQDSVHSRSWHKVFCIKFLRKAGAASLKHTQMPTVYQSTSYTVSRRPVAYQLLGLVPVLCSSMSYPQVACRPQLPFRKRQSRHLCRTPQERQQQLHCALRPLSAPFPAVPAGRCN